MKRQDWPKDGLDMKPADIITMYEDGFMGAKFSQEDMDDFLSEVNSEGGLVHAEDVCHEFGFADESA